MLSDMAWPKSLNNMEEVLPASILMCQSFPPNDPPEEAKHSPGLIIPRTLCLES